MTTFTVNDEKAFGEATEVVTKSKFVQGEKYCKAVVSNESKDAKDGKKTYVTFEKNDKKEFEDAQAGNVEIRRLKDKSKDFKSLTSIEISDTQIKQQTALDILKVAAAVTAAGSVGSLSPTSPVSPTGAGSGGTGAGIGSAASSAAPSPSTTAVRIGPPAGAGTGTGAGSVADAKTQLAKIYFIFNSNDNLAAALEPASFIGGNSLVFEPSKYAIYSQSNRYYKIIETAEEFTSYKNDETRWVWVYRLKEDVTFDDLAQKQKIQFASQLEFNRSPTAAAAGSGADGGAGAGADAAQPLSLIADHSNSSPTAAGGGGGAAGTSGDGGKPAAVIAPISVSKNEPSKWNYLWSGAPFAFGAAAVATAYKFINPTVGVAVAALSVGSSVITDVTRAGVELIAGSCRRKRSGLQVNFDDYQRLPDQPATAASADQKVDNKQQSHAGAPQRFSAGKVVAAAVLRTTAVAAAATAFVAGAYDSLGNKANETINNNLSFEAVKENPGQAAMVAAIPVVGAVVQAGYTALTRR
jgi:hypothetical protein